VADQAISDSLVGTIVWRHRPTSCPGGLTQLYRGNLKIYANNTSSFLGSVAILEEKGQVAGLELQSSLLLCHHPAFRTHLKDVLVVIHPDNVSSIVVLKDLFMIIKIQLLATGYIYKEKLPSIGNTLGSSHKNGS
jgi:hypothetical protein